MEIYNDGKTPEQKFSGAEFQIGPIDYHTWGCPDFVLKYPLQGGPEGLTKRETRARNGVYLRHYPLHAGSVDLLLNTRTGHVYPQ